MQTACEVKNLTKNYKNFTLDHVSFSLPSGCIMGLIGENGAGKSTTIRLILDLIRRDEGEITVLSRDVREAGQEIREEIGVVFDESPFPEGLTVREIKKILLRTYRTFRSDEFDDLRRRFDLPDDKAIRAFSRGMKMKLSIAIALSHDTKLLILDEATSGLDPVVRDEILDIFLDFIQDESHSVLISSHILSDLEKICDYITFLHKGKIVFSEEKDILLEKYRIVHCAEEEESIIPREAIIGKRKHEFGTEMLCLRERIAEEIPTDPATIEDIMLYYIKECAE